MSKLSEQCSNCMGPLTQCPACAGPTLCTRCDVCAYEHCGATPQRTLQEGRANRAFDAFERDLFANMLDRIGDNAAMRKITVSKLRYKPEALAAFEAFVATLRG